MNFDRIWVKIKLKIEKIKKLPALIVKHTGLVFVLLFLFSFLIGSILFYKYGYLIINKEIKPKDKVVSFNSDLYQKVIQKWEEDEKRLQEIEEKSYLNPFKSDNTLEEPGEEKEKKEPQLTEEEKEELLSNPDVQSLLEADNLFEFYTTKESEFLTIEERAKIWEQLNLGKEEEYSGGYYQNIKLLRELKKELTE